MNNSDNSKRPIRSYVIRSGRLTDSQRRAIEDHWSDYVIDYSSAKLDWTTHFDQQKPLTVEIGFGMGDSLLEMASAETDRNFLGIEVHKPGVGKLIHGAQQAELSNLKLMCHDAVEVLEHCFEKESIERVLIFFPDPWHKKRHNKRRLIQPEFVSLLSSKLKPGGQLHLATDWEPYAEHMLEVLEQDSTFENQCGVGQYWEQPARPPTKFERRGKRLGHGVWDLLYQKK